MKEEAKQYIDRLFQAYEKGEDLSEWSKLDGKENEPQIVDFLNLDTMWNDLVSIEKDENEEHRAIMKNIENRGPEEYQYFLSKMFQENADDFFKKYGSFYSSLINYITNEEDKKTYINEILYNGRNFKPDEVDLINIIQSIKDEEYKIECLKFSIRNGIIRDEFKIESVINYIDDKDFTQECIICDSKTNPTTRKNLINNLTDEQKRDILNKHTKCPIGATIILLNSLDDKEFTKQHITKISNKASIHDIDTIMEDFEDKEKFEILNKIDRMKEYRQFIVTNEFIIENIEIFLESENIDLSKKDIIIEMYKKNNDIVKADFGLFSDKILDNLTIDQINQISCYPDIAENIMNLDEKQLRLISKCIDNHMENAQTEEWTPLIKKIITNINSYSELIDGIEDYSAIDMTTMTNVMVNPNFLKINSIDDLEKYEEKKAMFCEKLIKSDKTHYKKGAIALKMYGITYDDMQSLVTKYGRNIDNIQDEYLKCFVNSMKEIMKVDSHELLDKIYEQVEPVKGNNLLTVERQLKNEYGKMFNEGLFKIDEAQKLEENIFGNVSFGDNVYDIGTDFRMISTSIAPFAKNNPENFKTDWNRPAMGSQHFCANYRRNDMLGSAPVPHISYGFSRMEDDALMLSGPTDIYSSGVSFESTAEHDEIYYTPDDQINKTYNRGKWNYNEMDWRRNQKGKKIQPDYIIVHKLKGSVIEDIDTIKKVYDDWEGKLPIVVVDIDKCLKAEKEKLDAMIEKYKEEPSAELAKHIVNKVLNNRKTTGCYEIEEGFATEVDISQYQKYIKESEQKKEKNTPQQNRGQDSQRVSKEFITEQNLEQTFQEVTATERNKETKKIARLYQQIKNIQKQQDGNEVETYERE